MITVVAIFVIMFMLLNMLLQVEYPLLKSKTGGAMVG